MVTDTDAIVLRQVKTVNGRRMLLLFSQKYGKISVGSNLTEGGKNKSALPQRPFTYGHYELFKARDSYNLNRAQVIKSYYGIGEDLDKYMAASYVLELTEKLLADALPQPSMFRLLLEFLDALERRSRRHETLVEAYIVKVIALLGWMSAAYAARQVQTGISASRRAVCFVRTVRGSICSVRTKKH